MRLSHGILLIPPLLGYDYDETLDNLIINEDEAPIVRLAFCMYLRGYTTGQIAESFSNSFDVDYPLRNVV